MALSMLTPGQRLDSPEGSVVVVIPLYNQHELFTQCLTSVLAHTPADVPVLVADDASPDPASRAWVESLQAAGHLRRAVHWTRAPQNEGFVGNCNRAFGICDRADVILLNSDCVVAAGWVDGLRRAVGGDPSVATATSLTNHGSIVSVPFRNTPQPALPQHITFDEAARAVAEHARLIRPRLPTAIGHCVLIRRAALDLVGAFDPVFAPGYGEEVDFSQRCIAAGLQHVLADDVLVLHQGGGTFEAGGGAEGRTRIQLEHEALVNLRYPGYRRAVEECESDPSSPLARALAIASSAILGPSVTVDVRCLGTYLTGTQVHALELVHGLWRTQRIHLRLLLPDDLGTYARPIVDAMAGVETIREHEVTDETRRDPIVHRPFQVSSLRDLSLLDKLGDRLIVTHQDLISYRNAQYSQTPSHWGAYRALTAEALATATMTVFFTQHAADDALADNLVPPARARVAHLGVDHRLDALQIAAREPRFAAQVADRPYLLCLGTNFKHKNRLFALRLLEALRADHGWDGRLVFCGPHVVRGSSAGLEAEWLAARPELAASVLDVSAVDESEKRWLLGGAAAVVYPTTYEGFGLVPFEAAAAGAPCAYAPVSALAELLPREQATILPWDAARSAERLLPLLSDGPAREAHVARLRETAAGLTWDATAAAMLAAYRDAIALPERDLVRVQEQRIPDVRYWRFRHELGGTALSLVDPEDGLLPEPEQRALAALARRPLTRGPLLAVLRLLSKLGGGGAPAAERPAIAPDVLPALPSGPDSAASGDEAAAAPGSGLGGDATGAPPPPSHWKLDGHGEPGADPRAHRRERMF